MKMCFILLCFIYSSTYCQDTIINKFTHSFNISILLSGHYKTFLKEKYIEPKEFNFSHPDILNNQFSAFNRIPTFGLRTGLIFTFNVSKKISITTGTTYLMLRDKYECNIDSFIKYHSYECEYHVLDVFKYNYKQNILEIPFIINYRINNITLSGGVWCEMVSFYKATYTFIPRDNTGLFNTSGVSVVRSFNYAEKLLQFVPFINVSYSMKIRDKVFNTYIGIDIGKKESIFMNLGVTVPLTYFQKKQTLKN